MWTVANLVEHFCHKYEFFVVNRNHDIGSEREPYPGIQSDAWNDVGNATVFYASREKRTARHFAEIVSEVEPDLVVLNSGFSDTCLKFLRARQKGLFGIDIPVLLFATGELSEAALSLKPLKKKLFLAYARLSGLYRGIVWKASFETEKAEVLAAIGNDAFVLVAPDLSPKSILPDFDPSQKPAKSPGSVKLVLLSRIVKKKNVDFLIERLKEIDGGSVELHIVGPVGDEQYWNRCRSLMRELPDNVTVKITGAVTNTEALRILVDSHFFVLSTVSENFGYVFLESMAAGSPIMISDRTVWEDVDDRGAGWRVPLEEPSTWVRRLEECISMNQDDYSEMSARARNYALEWLGKPDTEIATERVLDTAMRSGVKVAA